MAPLLTETELAKFILKLQELLQALETLICEQSGYFKGDFDDLMEKGFVKASKKDRKALFAGRKARQCVLTLRRDRTAVCVARAAVALASVTPSRCTCRSPFARPQLAVAMSSPPLYCFLPLLPLAIKIVALRDKFSTYENRDFRIRF